MESSSATAHGGFLSSPRAQRRLLWIGGGVFLVGLIVFLSAVVFRGSSGIHSPISTQAAQHVKPPKRTRVKICCKTSLARVIFRALR